MKNILLIVDDDEIITLLMKNLFEKKYTVFTANDGSVALDYLSQGLKPNLIISDLMMENITGEELIKQLFTHNLYKNIPVIVVSSTAKPELIQEFPSVQFIDKPFDPVFLEDLVASSQVNN